jgi:hypothetical protein
MLSLKVAVAAAVAVFAMTGKFNDYDLKLLLPLQLLL